MPKVLVSLDGSIVKEVPLTQPRTTVGRRPFNDIVIDHLAVSGEHAVLQQLDSAVLLEDLGSTNGTRVNGKRVKLVQLHHGDTIDIGKYQLRFLYEATDHDSPTPQPTETATPVWHPPAVKSAPPPPETGPAADATGARLRVLAGPGAGQELPLVKIVTTFGKPGAGVLAITHRTQGHALSRIEGTPPTLNGVPVGDEPQALAHGDLIALSDLSMEFLLH